MPRKKTMKRTINNQTSAPDLSYLKKMEKAFLRTPTQLAIDIKKEIAALKKTSKKLKLALSQKNKQTTETKTRLMEASKLKHTVVGKKQFITAKKKYHRASVELSSLNKQLQKTESTGITLFKKQIKLLALSKYLKQFERDWKIQSNKTPLETIAKSKKSRKKQINDHASIIPFKEHQARVETTNMIVDNVIMNDSTEAVS